ncbi:dihydrolipoamide acetyltransferase family protein [Streptomyces sp. NPDC093252]|uniref:dihydrolipoamide acetyltransferase family protein n=1 Tax=Streptomyces sp. NPDC093252 TaxID=3154980 RepID=UPI003420F8A6
MSVIEFALPDVGEGLGEAEIVEWLVPEGGRADRDQPVVAIETAKSTVEIPAPAQGVVRSHGAAVGDVVAVGSLLFEFESESGDRAGGGAGGGPTAGTGAGATVEPGAGLLTPTAGQDSRIAPAPTGSQGPPGAAVSITDHPITVPSTGRVLASPATRRRARELGMELTTVRGSGPAGRVTKADVLDAASPGSPVSTLSTTSPAPPAPPAALTPPGPGHATRGRLAAGPEAGSTVPLRGLRRQIAKTMTESWRTVPHITDVREVDASLLVAARASLRTELDLDVPFTFLPLIIRAVTASLTRVPVFNASIDMDAETITYHRGGHIGLATATPDGLIVPVLRDADALSLREIAHRVAELTGRARERKATPGELTGGTFTITNYGSHGGWIATPIIRPPEAAILGVGRIQDRVVAVDGRPEVRPVLTLAVSGDHRLVDGDSMGAFLNTLTRYLANPVLLLDGVRWS